MKITTYLYLAVLLCCLASCRKEDELTPSNTQELFAPDPNTTDEESVLRREFFEATQCYLLFNDTLSHEYMGLDGYGNPYYETVLVGLEWNLTAVSFMRFRFDYLDNMDEKRQAVEFLETYLMPYVENILPYSILAVNRIDIYSSDGGPYEYDSSPLTYSSVRCLAIALDQLQEPGIDYVTYAQDICCEMMISNWGGDPEYAYDGGQAEEFFAVNQWDYEEDKEWYDIPYGTGDEYLELFYDYGFLGNTNEEFLPTAKEDATAYIKACLTMSDEEFRATYGDWPTIMEKYEIIKPLVDATGIKF